MAPSQTRGCLGPGPRGLARPRVAPAQEGAGHWTTGHSAGFWFLASSAETAGFRRDLQASPAPAAGAVCAGLAMPPRSRREMGSRSPEPAVPRTDINISAPSDSRCKFKRYYVQQPRAVLGKSAPGCGWSRQVAQAPGEQFAWTSRLRRRVRFPLCELALEDFSEEDDRRWENLLRMILK